NAEDSSIVKGSLSDENGNFKLNEFSKGIYLLRITAFGYKSFCTAPIVVDSATALSSLAIVLYPGEINLNEVSVSAIRPTVEFKKGNITVNVENSPLAKGNTAYDLFLKLPGLGIDNNVISLNGKPGVTVMIDGRVQQLTNIQLMNLLKTINAESIEKMELLKNPPVKYDAAGTSGMVNIRMKKNKLVGFNGSMYTSSSQGFYGRTASGISLNYKAEKIALFSSVDYNAGYYQVLAKFNRNFTTDTFVTTMSAFNSLKDLEKGLNYKLGADWLVNEKNTIGFKIDGGPGYYLSEGVGKTNVSPGNDMGFEHLDVITRNPDRWMINNYNLNAEHSFDTLGTVLSFVTDYTRLSEIISSDIQNRFSDVNYQATLPANIYRNNNKLSTDILAAKFDFTKVIDDVSSLQAGTKAGFITTANNYVFERQDNNSGYYLKDTGLSNNYSYTEQTYAVYINYTRSIKKINMEVGLRGENTSLVGRNTEKGFELKRNYFNVFPNVTVEYAVSEKQNITLNLNRRIDRPQYNDLNPFRYYRDQYQYDEGNPFLLPHYSNTIELTHNYKESISNSFTYTRIDNVMLHYTIQNDSTKVFNETIKNMKLNNNFSYLFFFQKSLRSWWNISANALVSYIEYQGDVKGVKFRTASFFYTPSLTSTFIIPKKTKLEVLAFYRSGKNNGLVQVRDRWMLSFAVKKSFFKDKLDCSVGVNDVFFTGYFRTGVKFANQNWNYHVTQDSRRFTLSINYNFGRTKQEEREINSNEDEKGRLGH
ncbi:MAG TPA: outer membrane beta-barrel family protein, partial [Bacteroidia bacterium]